MRILVTGGAGFLGSNLTAKLLERGHEVVVIDNLSMGRMENLGACVDQPGLEFIEADVTLQETFDNLDDKFDCIVHLAAFKIPRYGKAIDTLQINYRGTECVLEYARKLEALAPEHPGAGALRRQLEVIGEGREQAARPDRLASSATRVAIRSCRRSETRCASISISSCRRWPNRSSSAGGAPSA